MPDLPARPDLTQLRHQAKDLLRSAAAGDTAAAARIAALADRPTLASAQLAIAREYGFASWPKLQSEVRRREILNRRDVGQLKSLIDGEPSAATADLEHFCDHPNGAAPLNYIAMLRFDAPRLGLTGALPGTGAIAQALIDADAAVDGNPGESETPLMTAASYGDAEVAEVLVDAGADVNALASPDAGGVPGGSALRHAAVFGATDVVDVLARAGALVRSLPEAAAVGDITGWLTDATPTDDRVRALVMAADHQRLDVVDQLLAAGTPIDASDRTWGRQALRVAAENGRVAAVRRLLERSADPNVRDPEHGRTPLEWCRHGRERLTDRRAHDQVEAMLAPVTAA